MTQVNYYANLSYQRQRRGKFESRQQTNKRTNLRRSMQRKKANRQAKAKRLIFGATERATQRKSKQRRVSLAFQAQQISKQAYR